MELSADSKQATRLVNILKWVASSIRVSSRLLKTQIHDTNDYIVSKSPAEKMIMSSVAAAYAAAIWWILQPYKEEDTPTAEPAFDIRSITSLRIIPMTDIRGRPYLLLQEEDGMSDNYFIFNEALNGSPLAANQSLRLYNGNMKLGGLVNELLPSPPLYSPAKYLTTPPRARSQRKILLSPITTKKKPHYQTNLFGSAKNDTMELIRLANRIQELFLRYKERLHDRMRLHREEAEKEKTGARKHFLQGNHISTHVRDAALKDLFPMRANRTLTDLIELRKDTWPEIWTQKWPHAQPTLRIYKSGLAS